MVRRGKTGLREHRRSLLHPFVVRERELKARSNLQPGEAEEFHSLHRLFTDASALGARIWGLHDQPNPSITFARQRADHWFCCGTFASPRGPDQSPVQEEEEFPSWTQPVDTEASVHSVGSSPDRSRWDLRVAVLLDTTVSWTRASELQQSWSGACVTSLAVRCILVACRTLLVITGLQRSPAIPDGLALTPSALGSSSATEAKRVGLGGFLNEKAFPAHSLWTINRH